jgi:hypothetical protein
MDCGCCTRRDGIAVLMIEQEQTSAYIKTTETPRLQSTNTDFFTA